MKKSIKKIISMVLVMAMLFSTLIVFASAAPASSKDRYSVLVLDVSGSMQGNKVAELKDGAKAFCEQVLKSNRSNNKIAIVTFASYSNLVCDFTNDIDTLSTAIDTLNASGGTDLAGGLKLAKNTLEAIGGDVIRNLIVMCDGAPNSTSAAYEQVKSIPLHWNIYGLYYSGGYTSSSASTVMKNVGRNGYYEVTDGSELVFSFIDNGETVTTESVNKTVIRVACPVDVSVTLNGVTLNKYNTKTTFGTLEFEGEDNEIKVLTLAYRNDYIIEITGTGEGTMDYDITYYCNDDQLYTLDYPTVDITPETTITTGVDVDDSSITLDIDNDGDGVVDENVSSNVSTTSIWYKVQQFFMEIIYAIMDLFGGIL